MRTHKNLTARRAVSGMAASLLAALVSCTEADGPASGILVRDSAGITITESPAPAWGPGEGWILSPEPQLEVGRSLSDPERQFHDIVGVVALQDGGMAVVDRGSQRLRIFDGAGNPVSTAGGEGEGPGEFRYIWAMARTPGDSILVMDENAIEVFSAAGEYMGSASRQVRSSLLTEPGVSVDPLLVNPNGSVLALVFEPQAGRSHPLNELFRPKQGWALFFPGFEDAAFLGWYPGNLLERIEVGGESIQLSPPFHTATYAAAGAVPLQIIVGDSEKTEVRIFDAEGRLLRISRWNQEAIPTEDAWVEAWKEAARYDLGSRRPLEQLEAAWARMHVPQRLPFFQALAVDAKGNLWIQECGAPTASVISYSILDPQGEWLGSVEVPAGLIHRLDYPVDIGADYFLGIWEDELGVQSVRKYRILK